MKRRLFGGITLDELACQQCMKFLDSIRLFSIPFVQIDSHEGSIWCTISSTDYHQHSSLFPRPYESDINKNTVTFVFTDDGGDMAIVHAMIQV